MNKLIIDIETIPNQSLKGDLKPQFDDTTVKLGNIKDPEKVKIKIEKAKELFETGLTKKMSLESNYCQVISIGFIEVDENLKEVSRGVLFDDNDDRSILDQFRELYNGQQLVGWNSKNFDIPIIRKRAILQGLGNIIPNFNIVVNPYNNTSIDLMHEWNGSNQYGKMSLCADLLGIPNKSGMDGSQIYDAWKDKKYDEIKAYNLEDCEVTLSIYKKIFS